MRRTTQWKRPARREELAGWYEGLLERQAESGLSVADFARSVGVSAWTLYQWRKRLAGVAKSEPDAPRLVEVSVLPASWPTGTDIKVRLRSGHHLEVSGGFDGDELKRLIATLESC